MPEPEEVRLIPADYTARLDLLPVFGRTAPLEIDIGCGDGQFLASRAASLPAHNFLGIERLLGRVQTTARRVARAGLTNVRVLRLELNYTVRYLLPPASVSAAHLLFPDPWPKRRHRRRRIFQPEFVAALCDALLPGGELFLKTDDGDYFRQMLTVASNEARLARDPRPFPPDYPMTGFERHYLQQGRTLYQARFARTDPPPPSRTVHNPAVPT